MITNRPFKSILLLLFSLSIVQCNFRQSPPDKIVFVSNRDGNYEIYTMNIDGSEQTRLTFNEANDGAPSWSPDGEWIVFHSDRDSLKTDSISRYALYVMKSDGTQLRRLTNNSRFDRYPDWSPNGEWIAYESSSDIYLIRPSGKDKTRLTIHPAADGQPAWFADGENILFDSNRYKYPATFGGQLFSINIHTLNLASISEEGFPHMSPSPSPDSKYVAYSTLLDPRIYILDMSSSDNNRMSVPYPSIGERIQIENLRKLLSNPLRPVLFDYPSEMDPSWSPDSQKLIFAWGKGGDAEIYTIDINSQEMTQLTDNNAHDFEPDWWSNNMNGR